jgi:hypothetical protein
VIVRKPSKPLAFQNRPRSRGTGQRHAAVSNKLIEIWGSELEPAFVLDLGDRLLNLGYWHTQAHGAAIREAAAGRTR